MFADIQWGKADSIKTSARGGFQCEQTLTFTLSVPADAKPSRAPGQIVVAESPDAGPGTGDPTARQIVIATTVGDFRKVDPYGLKGPLVLANGNTALVKYKAILPGQAPARGVAGLTPGRTYYISIRNWSVDLAAARGGNGLSCDAGSTVNAVINVLPAQ